jgi:hypothetical protein
LKQSLGLIISLFILLTSFSAFGQNNKLEISGSLYAEKAGAKNVNIIIIEIRDQNLDTIQIINVTPRKNPTAGDFRINLLLNKDYKIAFKGDTIFQETRYFDVSTKINEDIEPKDYFIKDLNVSIWIRSRIKKEGEIYFDSKHREFKVIRTE